MTDPTEKLRAGKGLLAGRLRAKREADLEECLRRAVARPLYGTLSDTDQDTVSDAIREVALPAIDQLKREERAKLEEEANRIPRLMAPPITLADSFAYAPLLEGGLFKTGLESRPANNPKAKRTAKALTSTEKRRRIVIFGAIQAKDRARKYCKTLDERKLAIPADWIHEGCPSTYSAAYRTGQPWRKRIQDEKSRYKKKYDLTPKAEVEKLLQ